VADFDFASLVMRRVRAGKRAEKNTFAKAGDGQICVIRSFNESRKASGYTPWRRIRSRDSFNEVMKSTITLTLLAIAVLTAGALAGCNQNTPGNSTDDQSTNSSVGDTNGVAAASTNMPATNSLTDVNTNTPATTNQ
jgi:hypothetical protein